MSQPSPWIIAAAQTLPVAADLEANLQQYLELVHVSARHGVRLLLFPELSLTGYEPQWLHQRSVNARDARLTSLKSAAHRYGMSLVVGAPTALSPDPAHGAGVHISALLIRPDGTVGVYHKQHLHGPERQFACPGPSQAFVFEQSGVRCGLAICADVSQSSHPHAVRQAGGQVYLASMVVSEQGYWADATGLQSHARTHQMPVLLSNMGGPSGGYCCAGRSAFWDENGGLVAALPGAGLGLLVVEKRETGWTGRPLSV